MPLEDERWKAHEEKVKYLPLQAKEGDLAVFLLSGATEIMYEDEKILYRTSNCHIDAGKRRGFMRTVKAHYRMLWPPTKRISGLTTSSFDIPCSAYGKPCASVRRC